MKHEFKVTRSKDQTIYTLESATGGSTSAGSIASVDSALGGVQRRNPPGDNILAQEKKEPPKPRNFVAKNAKMGGAGQHKDKKKAVKQGDVKHKKPLAEDHEIQMASSELQSIAKNAVHLLDLVRKYSEQEGLEAWQQSKITKSADYLNSVLQSISGKQSGMEETRNNYHANTTGFSRGQRDPEGENPQGSQQVWGLKINGKVWSKDGKDVTFTSKEAALNTRNAILKNKPDLEIGLVTRGGVAEETINEGMPADNDMGSTVGGSKMTLGQWKQMWMKKMPTADFASLFRSPPSMPGSAIAYFDGWMNNPDARWDPQRGVSEDTSEMGSGKGGMPEDAYMESLTNMLERSVSQAQHNLMVGVAHNPQFAQKVKVKQKVGQEFARADQGHDISKLPIRVPKKK